MLIEDDDDVPIRLCAIEDDLETNSWANNDAKLTSSFSASDCSMGCWGLDDEYWPDWRRIRVKRADGIRSSKLFVVIFVWKMNEWIKQRIDFVYK